MFCGITTLQIWPYLGTSKCWGHSVLQTPALVFCFGLGEPEWCATEKMPCLRERISRVTGSGSGQEEMIEERLSCDSANICGMHNLTRAPHSCKVILVSTACPDPYTVKQIRWVFGDNSGIIFQISP